MRRILTNRTLQIGLAVIAVAGFLAWHYQSQLIGLAARSYLQRVASREEAKGDLTQRRQTIARIHRQLLIAPPSDALVPELYDLVTLLSTRVATGEISMSWSAYVYTSHLRDTVLSRPDGQPRRSTEKLQEFVQKQVEFFYLRKRPDYDGYRVGDFIGDGDSYTVEEIEEAHRQGRDLSLE